MGWKGYTNTGDRLFGEVADKVIRHVPCDMVLIKLEDIKEFKSCLLPSSGGPNALLAATMLSAIATETKMTVTIGNVVSSKTSEEQQEQAKSYIDNTREFFDKSNIKTESVFIKSESIAGGIAKAGREYDLVAIGAAKEPFFRKILFGEIPEKVARYSPSAVMVVKKYEGRVKSLIKRILG